MARPCQAAWVTTILVALMTLASAQSTSVCTTVGNTATVVGPPSQATCAMFYTLQWGFLGSIQFGSGTAEITSDTYSALPRHVEFYRGNRCNTYMGSSTNIQCTAAPTTTAPTTAAPTTAAPTTAAPTTAAPTTAAPTTAAPTTAAPTTAAPTTAAPTTAAPTTAAPTTAAPTTAAPTTAAPTTAAPTVLPTNVYNGGPPPNQHRGVYHWNREPCLIRLSTSPSSCTASFAQSNQAVFIQNLRAPRHGYAPFTHVYLYIVPSALTADRPALQSFITALHDNGIKVELLGATASWVTSAANAAIPINICQEVKAYNQAVPARARFDGVHYDIEPHTLGGWMSNNARGKDRYNDDFQDNMIHIFRSCKSILSGTGVTLSWDAAPFYARFATDIWEPLVADPFVDYITFMNYVDTEHFFVNGDGFHTMGVSFLLNSLAGKVPAVFAADTSSPEFASPEQSFWDEGSLPLENMLGNVGYAFETAPGFAGTAIHAHGFYTQLRQVGPPVKPSCQQITGGVVINPHERPTGSVVVYRLSNNGAWTYLRATNVNGPGPYSITVTQSGPYVVELYDGPNQTVVALTVTDAICT